MLRLGNLPRYLNSSVHSGEDVILTASGPGSERVRGQIDNTAVFRVIVEALGLGHNASQRVLEELGYSPYSCLKARPIGQTLGHTFGDAPAFA